MTANIEELMSRIGRMESEIQALASSISALMTEKDEDEDPTGSEEPEAIDDGVIGDGDVPTDLKSVVVDEHGDVSLRGFGGRDKEETELVELPIQGSGETEPSPAFLVRGDDGKLAYREFKITGFGNGSYANHQFVHNIWKNSDNTMSYSVDTVNVENGIIKSITNGGEIKTNIFWA